jgi:hypothetical protein
MEFACNLTNLSPSSRIAVATLPLLPMVKENCPKSGINVFIKREELETKFFKMVNRKRQTQVFFLQFCEEMFKW